ncbi:MAG: carboxypeptidase regulatory-like domain-containing protein [Gemmatimonadota bacterium]
MDRHHNAAGHSALATLLVALVCPSLSAQEAGSRSDGPPPTAHLQGVVRDQLGGEVLSDVSVLLVPRGGGFPIPAVTDRRGRFLISPLFPGIYDVEFQRLGYRTAMDSVQVDPVSDIRMEVRLSPVALEMDPLIVTTTRRSRLELNGFYARQAASGGSFIDRQEIDDRRPVYLSDLLRTVPSLRTTQLRDGTGSVVLGRGGCPPIYYMDGIRLVDVQSQDLFVPPGDLEGVEVYTSANSPPQYPGNRCGSIVMWSREPTPTVAYGSFWRRLLVGVGFATGAFLLTR